MRRFTGEPKLLFSLDLHVLGTPPAFVLSQDQTLQLILEGESKTNSHQKYKKSSACELSMRFTVPPSSMTNRGKVCCYSVFKDQTQYWRERAL